MTRDDILDLFAYDSWANARVASTILELPQEQFTRGFGGSHPTVRDAFAHVVGTGWVWMERWEGRNPSSPPEWMASTDAALLAKQLRDVELRRESFLVSLSDGDLARRFAFKYLDGRAGEHSLRDLFVHVVNHSTFHRGQIVSMLRQAGTPAAPTDFVVYRAEVEQGQTDGRS